MPAEHLVDGDRIAERRAACNLTQRQLAHRAGVGLRTITRMETGPGVRFEFETVKKVAHALGWAFELTAGDGLRSPIMRYPAES